MTPELLEALTELVKVSTKLIEAVPVLFYTSLVFKVLCTLISAMSRSRES